MILLLISIFILLIIVTYIILVYYYYKTKELNIIFKYEIYSRDDTLGTNDINLTQTIETKTTSPIAEPVDPIGSAAAGGSSVRPDSQAAAIAGAAAAASGSGSSGEITLKPIKYIYDM